jgi:hypothetical protein
VAEGEAGRHATFDKKLPAMLGSMMGTAKDDEAIRIVVATLRAKIDVVQVQKNAIFAPWDHAMTAVSSHDQATNTRWDILPRAVPG